MCNIFQHHQFIPLISEELTLPFSEAEILEQFYMSMNAAAERNQGSVLIFFFLHSPSRD